MSVKPHSARRDFSIHPTESPQLLHFTLHQGRSFSPRKMADKKPLCTPAELMLKVILAGTLSHYETRGMIDDKRLEHMLAAGKQILYKTHQESEVR
jgi:palmitoyltransferase